MRPDAALAGPGIGTAGWSIPKALAGSFPGPGSHLQRYAQVMPVAEINSSFYRQHRRETYARWAESTPARFRFAAKLPKAITHERRLVDVAACLDTFVAQTAGLGVKLGVVLVQLPPSLAFDATISAMFFANLHERLPARCHVACEPRHASWFTRLADAVLTGARVGRVAADPVLAPGGEEPGGWPGLRYRRLHGSPQVYYSPYDAQRLSELAIALARDREAGAESWCMFDNTASGAALADAMTLQSLSAHSR